MPNSSNPLLSTHGLSFRAKRGFCFFLFWGLSFLVVDAQPKRPKILSIKQVRILTTDLKQANEFYYGILRTLYPVDPNGAPCNLCEGASVHTESPLEFDLVQAPIPKNLIGAVIFETDDAKGLRKFLQRNKVPVGKLEKLPSGDAFSVTDPENHRLVFVQPLNNDQPSVGVPGAYVTPSSPWPRIIHVGFVVKDRTVEDHFYKDILGFRPYWHGGMKDDRDDWVSLQVPDGAAWVEFMLNVPADANQHTLGVMNHVAFGVANMRTADQQLLDSPLHLTINEAPKIGRDGKWQLNLYDPDQTRVELMEFTPVQKPCCSEFTAPHPKP